MDFVKVMFFRHNELHLMRILYTKILSFAHKATSKVYRCNIVEFHKISQRKHLQLKQFVYALFTQKPKTATYAEAQVAVIEAWTR